MLAIGFVAGGGGTGTVKTAGGVDVAPEGATAKGTVGTAAAIEATPAGGDDVAPEGANATGTASAAGTFAGGLILYTTGNSGVVLDGAGIGGPSTTAVAELKTENGWLCLLECLRRKSLLWDLLISAAVVLLTLLRD